MQPTQPACRLCCVVRTVCVGKSTFSTRTQQPTLGWTQVQAPDTSAAFGCTVARTCVHCEQCVQLVSANPKSVFFNTTKCPFQGKVAPKQCALLLGTTTNASAVARDNKPMGCDAPQPEHDRHKQGLRRLPSHTAHNEQPVPQGVTVWLSEATAEADSKTGHWSTARPALPNACSKLGCRNQMHRHSHGDTLIHH